MKTSNLKRVDEVTMLSNKEKRCVFVRSYNNYTAECFFIVVFNNRNNKTIQLCPKLFYLYSVRKLFWSHIIHYSFEELRQNKRILNGSCSIVCVCVVQKHLNGQNLLSYCGQEIVLSHCYVNSDNVRCGLMPDNVWQGRRTRGIFIARL